MPSPPDTHVLLQAFVDELARCGVREACTSPGSRSSPIVLALVRDGRLRCYSHIDERCAGFFALGAAKASGRPVAVTCTSGTAAAHLAPAVIEAWEARVPLVVLTADRPPELRQVGAGQTIDQIKLYGGAVKWFFEVGTHEATPARTRWMRALACRAVWTALDGRPGPVHMNFALREPLVPPPDADLEPPPGRAGGAPWVARSVAAPDPGAAARELAAAIGAARRPLVVAGRADRGLAGVAGACAQLGWPLLADPLSGARRGAAAVAHYDDLLRSPALTAQLRPDAVVRCGDLPTSKPLREWLAGLGDGVVQVALDPQSAWQDPAASLRHVLAADPEATLSALAADPVAGPPGEEWLRAWRAADGAMGEAIDECLGDELSEPRVARELIDRLPADAPLFVASSMPVRDVERFAGVRDDPPRTLSNRGANGIDGTVSSGFGAAAVSAGPAVALVGDVALAHDIGGLLAHTRLGLSLTVVLLNNDGGGIFEFLPIAGERDAYEQHVATPHGLDFAHAAALYGCEHARVESLAAFRERLDAAVGSSATTIIEVRTDRAENLALHRRVPQARAG